MVSVMGNANSRIRAFCAMVPNAQKAYQTMRRSATRTDAADGMQLLGRIEVPRRRTREGKREIQGDVVGEKKKEEEEEEEVGVVESLEGEEEAEEEEEEEDSGDGGMEDAPQFASGS